MILRRSRQKKPARRFGWRRLVTLRPSARAAKISLAIVLLAGAGGGLAWAWTHGAPEMVADMRVDFERAVLSASARAGLAVNEVRIDGRVESEMRDVRAVIDARKGSPILAFDPYAAKAELEKLPWVRTATVERRLPGTIVVQLDERIPLALWQRHGRFTVIDSEGKEIPGTDPARFANRPVVVGDDAPEHAASLVALLETEPALMKRITAAVRVGARRWNLRLDNGIDVNLPEANAGAAYERLAQLERENGLIDRNLVAVDLRLPDRLILRMGRDQQPAQSQPAPAKRVTNKPT
ncbi:MAG: FtsQ-type POTRA domain-containing protein [Alphaproteobacteria bacterium]|nr:FtsQ-type POTRA domain-containing protein [Alphaproteobacteria bacterium]